MLKELMAIHRVVKGKVIYLWPFLAVEQFVLIMLIYDNIVS